MVAVAVAVAAVVEVVVVVAAVIISWLLKLPNVFILDPPKMIGKIHDLENIRFFRVN